jgi:hypothetical protein
MQWHTKQTGNEQWHVGQKVVNYDSSRNPKDLVRHTWIIRIGTKLLTTEEGTVFDFTVAPPRSRTTTGCAALLYSEQGWEEELWRNTVRSELMKLFEYGGACREIPLETMLKLSTAVSVKPPPHLQTETTTGERCDEILDTSGKCTSDVKRGRHPK